MKKGSLWRPMIYQTPIQWSCLIPTQSSTTGTSRTSHHAKGHAAQTDQGDQRKGHLEVVICIPLGAHGAVLCSRAPFLLVATKEFQGSPISSLATSRHVSPPDSLRYPQCFKPIGDGFQAVGQFQPGELAGATNNNHRLASCLSPIIRLNDQPFLTIA